MPASTPGSDTPKTAAAAPAPIVATNAAGTRKTALPPSCAAYRPTAIIAAR